MHRRIVVAIVLLGGVFLIGTWAGDRAPPYERISGKISPAGPLSSIGIEAGGVVEAEWEIRTHRTCAPARDRNVTRQIVDSRKTLWDFEGVPSVYGRELTARDSPDRIVRIFALPPAIASGPATYRSKACFVCNPLQNLWPICIDKPDIEFMIGEPTTRGPR